MDYTDLYQRIFDNIQESSTKSKLGSSSDVDRMNAAHNKHMTYRKNIYEFWTHKTILLGVAGLLLIVYFISRYWLVANPSNEMVKAINADTGKAISYFVTVVASWFVTTKLEDKR